MIKRLLYNNFYNPVSLKFEDRLLEKSFFDYYINRYINQLRLAHILAAIFFFVAVVSESFLIGIDVFPVYIRLGVVIPSFIFGLVITYFFSSFYKKYYQYFSIYYVLITSFSFILSGIYAPPPYTYTLYSGIIISLIFNYTFIRQSFVKASLTGLVVVIAYYCIAFNFINITDYLIHISIYITVANFLGMFICYLIEYDGKRSYLMLKKIESDAIAIKHTNEELEEKVERRTKKLKDLNHELQTYQTELEALVKKRTREIESINTELLESNKNLEEKNKELERLNDLFVGREFRIKELKDKVAELKNKKL